MYLWDCLEKYCCCLTKSGICWYPLDYIETKKPRSIIEKGEEPVLDMIIATVLVIQTLQTTISIYLLLLFIRVLLTWIPSINWMSQPFAALSQITDPYLNLFRSIIPPIGGLDLSPILAFIALRVLGELLAGGLRSLALYSMAM